MNKHNGHGFSATVAVALLLVGPGTVVAQTPSVNVSPVVLEGLSSSKERGVVKIMADPTLSDGRLVLKVVALNRGSEPAPFGPTDVKVFTAAGQAVALMSLEQLVKETLAAAGAAGGSQVSTFGSSGPTISHDSAGRPDVGGYIGGSNSMGTGVTTHGRRGDPADDPQVKAQIEALQAGILHPVSIAPAATVGGQVVTQKIKFGRKDERALRVVVTLNGEEHEFSFPAPPER